MTNSLTVYGHPASQPSRTVFWTCLLNNLRFTLGNAPGGVAGTGGTNPRGQVPSILDDGFNLAEACAIACYLCDKHGADDLYPKALQTRARIDQFLHMHHGLVRLSTLKLMAPHVVKPLGGSLGGGGNPLSILQNEMLASAFAADDPLTHGGRVVHAIAGFLEESYFNDAFYRLAVPLVVNSGEHTCSTTTPTVRPAGPDGYFLYFGLALRYPDGACDLSNHAGIHRWNMRD